MADIGAAELGQMTEGMNDSQRMIFQSQYGSVRKDRGTGLLLAVLGWDRFWLGQTGLGFLKYLTAGGCGIWWLIDIFTASSRCDDYNREKAQEIASVMRIEQPRSASRADSPIVLPVVPPSAERPSPDSSFIKGATLLESPSAAAPVVASGKGKTVFDPGPSAHVASPGAKLTGWLVSFTLTQSGDDHRLREGRNIVGAEPGCDVVVRDPSLSAKHAVIICRDGHVQLRDNDSTNGTYVNGEDVFGKGAVDLKNLDVVRFGRVEFRLYVLAQPEPRG
jgi:TM2 domain-containing membrane protein YozV